MATGEEAIVVGISATITRDYECRNVFPELRRGRELHCHTMQSSQEVFDIPRKLAAAAYQDAHSMNSIRRKGKKGGGVTRAYCGLIKQLDRELGLDWESHNFFRADGQIHTDYLKPVVQLFHRMGISPATVEAR